MPIPGLLYVTVPSELITKSSAILNSGNTLPQPAIVDVRSKSTGVDELSNTVSSIKVPSYETLTLSEKLGEFSEPP